MENNKYFYVENNTLCYTKEFKNINFIKLTKVRALKLSIQKWEFILNYPFPLISFGGYETCGLCRKYYISKEYWEECINCPIFKKTKTYNCCNTPLEELQELINNPNFSKKEYYKLIKKELNFLKRLLKEYDK